MKDKDVMYEFWTDKDCIFCIQAGKIGEEVGRILVRLYVDRTWAEICTKCGVAGIKK